MRRIRHLGMRKTIVVTLAVLLTVGMGSTIFAQSGLQGHIYYACLAQSNGQLYSVQIDNPDLDCRTYDTLISWNQVGPPGPAGPNGEAGTPGEPGNDGMDGTDGQDGAPGLIWKGDWNEAVSYEPGDAVAYLGGSFIAVAANTGEEPGSGPAWHLLAAAGAPGADGLDGIQGPPGDSGETSALEARIATLENQVALLQAYVPGLTDLPALSIDSVKLEEGDDGLTPFVFTVTLSPASSETVSVDYVTTNGTAAAHSDYQMTSGTLVFQPGVTSQQLTVNVIGDTASEINETFFVNLSNAQFAAILNGQGTGTILNDDIPSLSIQNASCKYGSPCEFSVRLSGPTHEPVTVRYETFDNTAVSGTHYSRRVGTLYVTPGQTVQVLQVPSYPRPWNSVWGSRTFYVELSHPVNATLSPVWKATGFLSS